MGIDELLTTLVQAKGSDLHLKVGLPPVFRVDGLRGLSGIRRLLFGRGRAGFGRTETGQTREQQRGQDTGQSCASTGEPGREEDARGIL